MTWYWYFLLFWVVAFLLFLVVVKLSVIEEKSPSFKEKMNKVRVKLDPKIKFFENLFWWVAAAAFIWFIYLGQGS